MYSKIQITGILEVVTGMHIGGSSAFSAIGAVDAPVIKDIRTNRPMIPGSSLKGKMRTLLAKRYNEIIQANPNNSVCHDFLFRPHLLQTYLILISSFSNTNPSSINLKLSQCIKYSYCLFRRIGCHS